MNYSLIITIYPTLMYVAYLFYKKIYEYIPKFDDIISYESDYDNNDDEDDNELNNQLLLLAFNQIQT